MKLRTDPRHLNRIKVMKLLFTWNFLQRKRVAASIAPIIENLSKIDKLITESAPDRPIEGINRIDLAILRLAVFELIIKKGTPPKVVVDEAVEMGKEYGSDSSSSFINGVLGKIIKSQKLKV